MKAPDKLYISKNIYSTFMYQVPNPDDKTEVEYVRADAFIEKATLFFIDKLKELPMGNGKMKIKINESLENFIDDFVNYMKGE